MPRGKKIRMVSGLPRNNRFSPMGVNNPNEILMTLDEYETIKLIDYEGLTQEECARLMQVARTTVQQIYSNARKKVATMILEEKSLLIQGGCYKIGQHTNFRSWHHRNGCPKKSLKV